MRLAWPGREILGAVGWRVRSAGGREVMPLAQHDDVGLRDLAHVRPGQKKQAAVVPEHLNRQVKEVSERIREKAAVELSVVSHLAQRPGQARPGQPRLALGDESRRTI